MVYDKRDAFNFNIVNFPYMSSNIPANPTYGVYISQLIRISRICDTFERFVIRHRLLTERLIRQGFRYSKLCKFFTLIIPAANLFLPFSCARNVHKVCCSTFVRIV